MENVLPSNNLDHLRVSPPHFTCGASINDRFGSFWFKCVNFTNGALLFLITFCSNIKPPLGAIHIVAGQIYIFHTVWENIEINRVVKLSLFFPLTHKTQKVLIHQVWIYTTSLDAWIRFCCLIVCLHLLSKVTRVWYLHFTPALTLLALEATRRDAIFCHQPGKGNKPVQQRGQWK